MRKPKLDMWPMSSVDHAWLRMDNPTGPMVINAILTFKHPLSISKFQTLIAERFASIERFQCKPNRILMSDYWQQCILDWEYHLSESKDTADSSEQLQDLATRFINQPFDTDHPLWRMHLIPFQKGSAVVIRIHHAYADGMALVKVLLQITDEGQAFKHGFAHHSNSDTDHPSKPSIFGKVLPYLSDQSKWFETLGLIEELTSELLNMSLSSIEHNLFKDPGLCGKKQLVWTEPLKLEEVRAIAKAHNAKLNDILVSSAAGAFRRYMQQLHRVSAWAELRTVIPVDLRKQLTPEALGNYFGLVFLSLPVGVEDPIERARLINKRMHKLKSSKQAWLVFQILQLSGYLPDIAEKELIRLFSSKASAVMTNVPGPSIPLHVAGNTLDQILFWVPQSGSVGMGISIITYNNRVQFGLMSDQQLVNEPHQLIDCFNEEFEQLLLETLMTVHWPD